MHAYVGTCIGFGPWNNVLKLCDPPSASPPSLCRFPWRVKRDRDGTLNFSKIKISNFPSLQVTRTPDGGWRMHNKFCQYVADFQSETAAPHALLAWTANLAAAPFCTS